MPLLGVKENLNMFDMDTQSYSNLYDVMKGVKPMGSVRCELEDGSDNTFIADAKVCVARKPPKCVRQFDEIEIARTEVRYRCMDCRGCLKCKNGPSFDAMIIQEEIEQSLIERCVQVDVDRGITIAKLPFVTEPDSRLVPNEHEALNVYRGQMRKSNLKPDDKRAVIESEQKLQKLSFVDYVSNLKDDDKAMILSSDVKYFIPWRAVWNEKSLSTDCRLDFDGSQGTKGDCSLNSLLAKGANGINNLIGILIRRITCRHAFHTDISKMYNAVRLNKTHWRYQLYLWNDDLTEGLNPYGKLLRHLYTRCILVII